MKTLTNISNTLHPSTTFIITKEMYFRVYILYIFILCFFKIYSLTSLLAKYKAFQHLETSLHLKYVISNIISKHACSLGQSFFFQ